VADNKIYWAGGANSFSQSLKPSGMVEVYDVFAKTSSMACLSHPDMWNPQGVAEVNGKLVFFAGYGFSGAINRIDVYDVATNTWSIGLLNQNLYNCSIISVNNTIYVAGGSTSQTTGTLSDQVWKLLFYTK